MMQEMQQVAFALNQLTDSLCGCLMSAKNNKQCRNSWPTSSLYLCFLRHSDLKHRPGLNLARFKWLNLYLTCFFKWDTPITIPFSRVITVSALDCWATVPVSSEVILVPSFNRDRYCDDWISQIWSSWAVSFTTFHGINVFLPQADLASFSVICNDSVLFSLSYT